MRLPDSLTTLIDYGIIEEVVRPLMSGKEAQVYLVRSEGEIRVAKVYKEAQSRTFKHRSVYTEGRKTRNSRDQRAINKRTRHGRAKDEAAWRSTEVDMIYRLRDAGVRVPEPHQFIDGVLIMELLQDADGQPAPRLGDLTLEPAEAQAIYDILISEVVRMLCAGVVHGDLSEFNVLMAADGPAVIDFPQSIDPAGNQNGRRLLLRDVENLHRFLARHAPEARRFPYAEEMWELYQSNRLEPGTKLTGGYKPPAEKTDTKDVLDLIADAREEEHDRREARGEELPPEPTSTGSLAPETETRTDARLKAKTESKPGPKPLRRVVDLRPPAPKRHVPSKKKAAARRRSAKPEDDAAPKKATRKKSSRRRRRARKADPTSEATPKRESPKPRDAAPKKSDTTSGQSPTTPKKRARRRRRRPAAKRPGQSGV
jgi:RIO kinase 1